LWVIPNTGVRPSLVIPLKKIPLMLPLAHERGNRQTLSEMIPFELTRNI
jgi:hypothetical protein